MIVAEVLIIGLTRDGFPIFAPLDFWVRDAVDAADELQEAPRRDGLLLQRLNEDRRISQIQVNLLLGFSLRSAGYNLNRIRNKQCLL